MIHGWDQYINFYLWLTFGPGLMREKKKKKKEVL